MQGQCNFYENQSCYIWEKDLLFYYNYIRSNCIVLNAVEHVHISNLSEKRKKNKETSEAALCTVECDYCDISGAGTNIFPFIMKKSLVFKYGKLVFRKTWKSFPIEYFDKCIIFVPYFVIFASRFIIQVS